MAGYIFVPVPTQEMMDFAKDWTDGQIAKGKPPYTVLRNAFVSGALKGFMRRTGHGVLRGLVATDKLYVLSHGAALGSRRIGASRGAHYDAATRDWEGGTMKSYTPDQLAKVLEEEGLLKSFVDLRVFTCGSGLVPPVPGETKSFAEKLRDSLRARGYTLLTVTGYLGSVRTSYVNRQTGHGGFTPDDHKGVEIGSEIMPASSQRVTFH